MTTETYTLKNNAGPNPEILRLLDTLNSTIAECRKLNNNGTGPNYRTQSTQNADGTNNHRIQTTGEDYRKE